MSKVIFLDIDGPMIPVRAYILPRQTRPATVFDPVAKQMVKLLIKYSKAQIVVASTWRKNGRQACVDLLKKNGIAEKHLHFDWCIDEGGRFSATRGHCIQFWLHDHPEVTHFVSLDDEDMRRYAINQVYCDTYEGMSYRNYMQALLYLDVCDPRGVGNDKREDYEMYVTFLSKSSVAHVTDDREISAIMEEIFPDKQK